MSDYDLTPAPAGPPENQPQPQENAGFWDALRTAVQEALQIIAPALVLALIVHLFLAQATIVFGQSMEPNLHQNERLIVDKLSYRVRAPARGDIVVVDMPSMEEMLVKRIVALPGEQVEIQRGVVYVNDAPLYEPFAHDTVEYDMPPLTLGPLSYFVLGDNRGNSNDSRSFGPITRDQIMGRVWLRYWPLDNAALF
ncbi:MAG: signal peptidase I [Tetrasphaera sp.]